jgi:hypothetical protein
MDARVKPGNDEVSWLFENGIGGRYHQSPSFRGYDLLDALQCASGPERRMLR